MSKAEPGVLSETISVRLFPEDLEALDRRMVEWNYGKRSECIRAILTSSLKADPATEKRNRLAEIQDEIRKMRLELLHGVSALLVTSGKCTPEEALEFVKTDIMQ